MVLEISAQLTDNDFKWSSNNLTLLWSKGRLPFISGNLIRLSPGNPANKGYKRIPLNLITRNKFNLFLSRRGMGSTSHE